MNLRLVALAIAGVVFVLDRVTKIRIEQSVSPFETHEVIPGFFNIIHTQNRGAAFSLFANLDDTWRTVFLVGFSLGALAVVISLLWSATKPQQPPALALIWGLGLILGGAAGIH